MLAHIALSPQGAEFNLRNALPQLPLCLDLRVSSNPPYLFNRTGLFYKHRCHWFSESAFSFKSSENIHSQTVRARELIFWEKGHLPPPVICHMSCVMCNVSCVMCHVSCVMCQKLDVMCQKEKNKNKKYEQSGETSGWRVYYLWGYSSIYLFKVWV